MKRVLLATAVAALVLSASAGRAARTESARYELGLLGDQYTMCDGLVIPVPATDDIPVTDEGNYGGACFAVNPGETSVIGTMVDDVMPAVGLTLAFYNAAGIRLGDTAAGCIEVRSSIPAGTVLIEARANGAVFSTLVCGTPLPATSGEITLELS